MSTSDPDSSNDQPPPPPPRRPSATRQQASGRLLHHEQYRWKHSPTRIFRAYFYDIWLLLKEAKIPLLSFVLLATVNVLYLAYVYQHPHCEDYAGGSMACLTIPRALFETVRMLVFEVNLDWPEDDYLGQALFFITPLLGVALIFQSVLEFGRHLLDKGSRREAWQIALATTFRDHVVVCGFGRVSYRVMLQLLAAGYEVVVVEQHWESEFVAHALKHKVPVILGNACDPDVLRQAGLPRARGIVAGTNDDLVNIEIALTARRVHAEIRVVMRIFHDDLDINLERTFGAYTAYSSSALAAPTLAAAAVSSGIVHVMPISSGLLGIVEMALAPDSTLTGFANAIEERHNVRLLRWLDEQGHWRYPQTGYRFEGGDIVLLIGTLDALNRAREENQPSNKLPFIPQGQRDTPDTRPHTVIVCGLGKVGYRVVHELNRKTPRPEIVVVYKEGDTRAPFVSELRQLGVRLVQGDARQPEVLHEAGIDHAHAVVAVTGNNLSNIQVCMLARRLCPTIDVVLRVFSDVLAEELDEVFGAYTAFSTSALAASTMAAAAVQPGVRHAITLERQLLSATEQGVQTGGLFAEKTVGKLYADHHIFVIALQRSSGERLVLPGSTTTLHAGDRVEILADSATLARLEQERQG